MKLQLIQTDPIESLDELLQETRSAGWVTLFVAEHDQAISNQLLDAFMELCDCVPQAKGWKKIGTNDAKHMLSRVLQFDLAYENQVMNEGDTQKIVADYLKLFKVDSDKLAFFSNFGWDAKTKKMIKSDKEISRATLGFGIVAASQNQLGLILVEDEE